MKWGLFLPTVGSNAGRPSFLTASHGSEPSPTSTGMTAHKVESVWKPSYESNQRSNNTTTSL